MKRELPGIWRVRGRVLDLRHGVIMGIVNVTPDSFYEGSRFTDAAEAVERARELVRQGAAIVDIGGESTRPGAQPVGVDEELRRVVPVIARVAEEGEAVVSVDTRRAAVARAALEAGAHVVNDVSALADEGMAEVVREFGAGVVLMHMHGTPQTMQEDPLKAEEVLSHVKNFLKERLLLATEAGIMREALAIDPGIGFGKTFAANERLLAELGELTELGVPVVVGASRKRFIGARTGRTAEGRLAGSIAAAVLAYERGARILRVHDVEATRDALAVTVGILEAGTTHGAEAA